MAGFLWALLGIAAGACIAIQGPINAQLARGLGLPVAAAAMSFVAGAMLLVAVTAVSATFAGVSLNWRAPAPWTFVAGGFLGAAYVTAMVFLVPRLGAAAVIALAVAGQLLAGLLLDRMGFLGLDVRELSLGRIGGVVLLVLGVVMIRFL